MPAFVLNVSVSTVRLTVTVRIPFCETPRDLWGSIMEYHSLLEAPICRAVNKAEEKRLFVFICESFAV